MRIVVDFSFCFLCYLPHQPVLCRLLEAGDGGDCGGDTNSATGDLQAEAAVIPYLRGCCEMLQGLARPGSFLQAFFLFCILHGQRYSYNSLVSCPHPAFICLGVLRHYRSCVVSSPSHQTTLINVPKLARLAGPLLRTVHTCAAAASDSISCSCVSSPQELLILNVNSSARKICPPQTTASQHFR